MSCVFAQRETLLRQLETNQLDMDATLEELCVQQETEDQNYEMYSHFSFVLLFKHSETLMDTLIFSLIIYIVIGDRNPSSSHSVKFRYFPNVICLI